jgi:PPOX class probable FMN-dependent enzyme
MAHMTDWMQELILLSEAEYHARRIIATLATVDPHGHPRARTMIVRWFDEQHDTIWMTTDSRSPKISHLLANPEAELVFWALHERQQFRVYGRMEIVESGSARQDIWEALNDASRALFFGPSPGELRRPEDVFPPAISAGVSPPETFVLLGLKPTEAEALELNEFPHRRRRWREAGGWKVELLNP